MLTDFVKQCENMTGPEIEAHFNDCSSLFLARITSWLRITYVTNIYYTVLNCIMVSSCAYTLLS